MDDKGNLVEGLSVGLPEREIEFAKICKSFTTETDPCEKSYNFHKCFVTLKHGAAAVESSEPSI